MMYFLVLIQNFSHNNLLYIYELFYFICYYDFKFGKRVDLGNEYFYLFIVLKYELSRIY